MGALAVPFLYRAARNGFSGNWSVPLDSDGPLPSEPRTRSPSAKAGMSSMFGSGGGKGHPNRSYGGQPTPGYDADGKRSWNAGAEGYTPIDPMATAGPNLQNLFNKQRNID